MRPRWLKMPQWLRDLRIERKLILIIAVPSITLLIASIVAFMAFEMTTAREAILEDLRSTARLLAANSKAALTFGDKAAAREIMLALQEKKWIAGGVILDSQGQVISSYISPNLTGSASELRAELMQSPKATEGEFTSPEYWHVVSPVQVDGQVIGSMRLLKNKRELTERFSSYLTLMGAVGLLALIAALMMASSFQRIISHPVMAMMGVIREVAAKKDYSLRAQRFGRDELGHLADSLNGMLERIEVSNNALSRYNEELEEQVMVRTAQLLDARDRAEEASRAKSQFLANMSHEVRTPLNGVVGMLKLLGTTPLDTQQRRYIRTALTASDSLLNVINDILDFSKIEAGKLKLEETDFNLEDIVESAAHLFSEKAAAKNLEMICIIDPDTPLMLRGDGARLNQVLDNLINNAVKFTESGEVIVRARAEAQDDATATIVFTVADTGIGIPADKQAQLFSAFNQADSSMTRKYGGTGLGLAICKQLVTLMGGTISVESEAGKGSTFHVRIAIRRQPAGSEERVVLPRALRGVRILVVDDHPVSLTLLCDYATHWGCQTEGAASAEEALNKLTSAARAGKPFAAAVIDRHLPAMSAEELARRIRCEALTEKTALILLLPFEEPESARLQDLGFAAFAVKPVRRSELYDALIRSINGPAPKPAPGAARAARAPELLVKSGRILVAEDNEVNQIVAREMLRQMGYECDCVANGRDAVSCAQSGRYDLVLMDCQMPEMDGYDATRAIRAFEGGNGHRRMPIIALTAHAISGDRELCMAAGMDDYLTKPIMPEVAQLAIEQWLAKARGTLAPAGASAPHAHAGSVGPGSVGEVFNREALLARCMGRADLVETLIRKFTRQVEQDLRDLAEALAASDADRLARTAHRIKGSAANIAAERIRTYAADLEQRARTGGLGQTDGLLDQLAAEVHRFDEAVQAPVSG